MHLAVITVVYNNYNNLADFLASFNKQTNKDFHIYIVDASDKPYQIQLPSQVSLVKVKNGGYAYGLNKGLAEAMAADYTQFVFINDDVSVAPDFVEKASLSIIEHPETLIGGKIYYYPGHEYHKDRYRPEEVGHVLWYAGGEMDWAHAMAKHIGVDEVDTGLFNAPTETGFVTGCLMCFDSSLVEKAGKMDESYFLYYEDTDWCQRIVKSGAKLWYDPSIIIWHKNAQSSGGSGSGLQSRYQRWNIMKFGLRYAPFRTKVHLVINYLMGR